MKEGTGTASLRHGAGLLLVAVLIGGLALLWIYGPTLLEGTIFDELFGVFYVAAVFGVLTLAERIVGYFGRH